MPPLGTPEYLLIGTVIFIIIVARASFLYLEGRLGSTLHRYHFIVEDKRFRKFTVELTANNSRAAQMQAAEIGKTLGILLVGPT